MQHLCPLFWRYWQIFTSLIGQSPEKYIIKLRIQSACELLASTDMTIQQIAKSVGYEDQQYFARLFRKYLGTSPSNYRATR